MKAKFAMVFLISSTFLLDACDDFLEYSPKGTLTEAQVKHGSHG